MALYKIKFMVADECAICGSKRLFVCHQVGITDNWRTVETRPLKHAHDYEHTQAPRTNQPAL